MKKLDRVRRKYENRDTIAFMFVVSIILILSLAIARMMISLEYITRGGSQ